MRWMRRTPSGGSKWVPHSELVSVGGSRKPTPYTSKAPNTVWGDGGGKGVDKGGGEPPEAPRNEAHGMSRRDTETRHRRISLACRANIT